MVILSLLLLIIILLSCGSNRVKEGQNSADNDSNLKSTDSVSINTSKATGSRIKEINNSRVLYRLSHHVNTSASEYYPVLSNDGKTLYFTGMDRTGYFDYKIDFTKTRNNGGEDIFYSKLVNGIWTDSKDVKNLNTNAHEAVNQVFNNGSMLLTGNYIEKLGPKDSYNGTATTDLFIAEKSNNNSYRLIHFDEPVNSIYTEADGYMNDDKTFILFVSDRPGCIGEYHKKGWRWENNLWGNTDVFVSLKEGDVWSVPINLSKTVNTPYAERTPWLSRDGLTLYISSNGYKGDKRDMDIFCFKRKDLNNWTKWDGPYSLKDANSDGDDWGYKEYNNNIAYISRSMKLQYKPTQPGKNGDGFLRETNFRTGYNVTGAQSGSLKGDEQADIYCLIPQSNPIISLPDIIFKHDSYEIGEIFKKDLDRLIDIIKNNDLKQMTIEGHTDSDGSNEYNLILSEKRAQSIREYIITNGIKNTDIKIKGYGKSKPLTDNKTKEGKAKNRRVEIFFKDKK